MARARTVPLCTPISSCPVRRTLPPPQVILHRRGLQQSTRTGKASGSFGFAFDIDGVLLRSSKPLPRAKKALSFLQKNRIPFVLLTNGGGKTEAERVADLSRELQVPIDERDLIQSHTPFADLVHGHGKREGLRDKCILVTGGDGDRARLVAEAYGFRNVVSPGDIYNAHPEIWPFSKNFSSYYASHARPLPAPVYLGPSSSSFPLDQHLKINAIFIYNDPRDWGLDTTLINDLLLSHAGYLGTTSGRNGRSDLPNRGYQQDGQPALWFSNPDLLWASSWHQPRLGQGGFRESFEGVWRATSGGAKLERTICGKPHQATYEFAEKRLVACGDRMRQGGKGPGRVYMVGDNPASDILGANQYRSPGGSKWHSILVRSGVYSGGDPAEKPGLILDDVWDAVEWASAEEGLLDLD